MRWLKRPFCWLFGHDWAKWPDAQDDVFVYWAEQCRCCGKWHSGSFAHYQKDPTP